VASGFLIRSFDQVVLNGQVSSTAKINAGVPQGSILGPTLFLVFINDLSNVVQSQINMFADDTTLSAVSSSR
jgi:ribonuclease P/MRP protein subunit RPP40